MSAGRRRPTPNTSKTDALKTLEQQSLGAWTGQVALVREVFESLPFPAARSGSTRPMHAGRPSWILRAEAAREASRLLVLAAAPAQSGRLAAPAEVAGRHDQARPLAGLIAVPNLLHALRSRRHRRRVVRKKAHLLHALRSRLQDQRPDRQHLGLLHALQGRFRAGS